MIRTLLGAKIHGCICTDVDLNYEGSILIDEDWIDFNEKDEKDEKDKKDKKDEKDKDKKK